MNKRLVVLSLLSLVLAMTWGPSSYGSEQSVLHWEVNAALGLTGGPTPEQLATGKPALFSEEEIQILRESEIAACKLYQRVLALYAQGGRGGEMDKFGLSGLILSRAQARHAWAQGKVSLTVARMEQAVKFAEYLVAASEAAYNADTITLDAMVTATESLGATKLSLIQLKRALRRLGYDLADVSMQPQIDPKKPNLEKDCSESPNPFD